MASQPLNALAPSTSMATTGLNIGGNSGSANNPSIDLATGNMDIQAAAETLRQRLLEGGMTLKCTILRKRIKPVTGTD